MHCAVPENNHTLPVEGIAKTFEETYVPVKSKLKHPPPPPGHLNFWKIFGKFPPPEAEKLFKCPIIGPSQVIKYLHPQETFQ